MLRKKIVYFAIGFVTAEILYEGVFVHLLYTRLAVLPWRGEEFAVLDFIFIRPFCILIGSLIVGYNINKNGNRIFLSSILFNPGILFSIVYIMRSVDFYSAYQSNYLFKMILILLEYSLFWMTISSIGIFIGSVVQKKYRLKTGG